MNNNETINEEDITFNCSKSEQIIRDEVITDTGNVRITYSDLEKLMFDTIYKYFPLNDYSLLKNEKQVLEHFYYNEKFCLEYINRFTGDRKRIYKEIIYGNIQEIFETNKSIRDYSQSIIKKINKIDSTAMTNEAQLISELDILFGTVLLPKCIIREKRKEIKNKVFIETYRAMNYRQLMNKNENEQIFIKYYNEFENNISKPFSICGNKPLYFLSLLLSNYSNINKSQLYKNLFFNFQKIFIDIFHLGNEYKDSQYLVTVNNYINAATVKNENILQKVFNSIKEEAQSSAFLIVLFASYYFLLRKKIFNLPSFSNNARYVNLLQSLIRFFTPLFKSYHCDIKSIIKSVECFFYRNSQSNNNEIIYTHEELNAIINTSTDRSIIQRYKLISNKLTDINEEGIIVNFLGNILSTILKSVFKVSIDPLSKIKLIPFSHRKYSSSITILISGFLSENDDHTVEWENYINSETKHTMYYFYQWPSGNLLRLLCKFLINKMKFNIDDLPSFFKRSQYLAKQSGKLLGIILRDRKIFGNASINLVGFSLGCHVIKSCIKELYDNDSNCNNDLINNVVLLGGATAFDNKEKWNRMINKVVSGTVFNCYSKSDSILEFLYQPCSHKSSIGRHELILDNVVNCNLTAMNIGHLDYRKRFKDILRLIGLSE